MRKIQAYEMSIRKSEEEGALRIRRFMCRLSIYKKLYIRP